MKRFISSFLALLLLVTTCVFCASCEGTEDDQSKSNVSASSGNDFFGLELPENLDFGNDTVRVLTTATAQSPTVCQIQPNSNSQYSAETATAVITAAAECTRLVEERLNLQIEEEVVYTFSRYGGEMYQRIHRDAMSDTGDYIFAMPCTIEAAMLAMDGLLYDLKDVPHIDLEREWWCEAFNDSVEIMDSNFFAISDIGTVSKEATLFIAFNKKMANSYNLTEKYGYTSLYEMVDEKAWTLDVLLEMAKSVYQDNNSNNMCDPGDVNGLAGQSGAIYNFLTAADEKIVEVDGDGYPVLAVYNERAINLIGDAQEYFSSAGNGFICANDYFSQSQVPVSDVIVPEFKADRCLFFMDAIMNLNLIREMESDFGVLPVPMYDDTQDGYRSQIGCWSANCITIPTFVRGEDLEKSAYVIEALSAVSNDKLNPVYYEQTLQYQISRDDDSMRMLDIIFGSRTCELAEVYNLDVFNTIVNLIDSPPGTFASAFDAIDEKTELALEEIIAAYEENQK